MAKNQFRIQERKLNNGKICYMPQVRENTFFGWFLGWIDMSIIPEYNLDDAIKKINEQKKDDEWDEGNQVQKILRNIKA